MSCCKKDCDSTSGNNFTASYAFIVLILFILLAIIWGGAFYWKEGNLFFWSCQKIVDIYIKFGYNVNVRLPEKAGSAYIFWDTTPKVVSLLI